MQRHIDCKRWATDSLLLPYHAYITGSIKRSSTASEESATATSPPLKKALYDNDGPIQVTAQENPALIRDGSTLTPVYMLNTSRDGQTILTQFSPQPNVLSSSQSAPQHILSPPHVVFSSSPQYAPIQQLVSLVQHRTGSTSPQLIRLSDTHTSPLLKHTSSSGSSSDSASEDSDNEEQHAMGTSPLLCVGSSPRTSPPPLQSVNPQNILSLPSQQSIMIPQPLQQVLVPVAPKQHMLLQPIGSNNSVLQLAYPDSQIKMIQQPVLIGKPGSAQQSFQLVAIANNNGTSTTQLN